MRIKPAPESPDGKPVGPGTRATRSSAHAQKRHDDRHAERDYFGNVIKKPVVNSRPTVGAALAEMSARGGTPRPVGAGSGQPAAGQQSPAPSSMRLDAALVARGLAPSREKAKASIAAGLVYVNGSNEVKASSSVASDAQIEVRGVGLRYVGRGGLKLERALESFDLDATGARCLDLGASTGGFTDCLLQHGAAGVVAVDVGHGQLDPGLRQDPRVVSLEGLDAREVTPQTLARRVAETGAPLPGTPSPDGGLRFDVVVADLSFISLGHVLDGLGDLLVDGGHAVLLVKPQFEAGRERVGKRGVVKDPDVHREVLSNVASQARQAGLAPRGLDYSPVKGTEGNIEYLLFLEKGGEAAELDPRAVVDAAHKALAQGA